MKVDIDTELKHRQELLKNLKANLRKAELEQTKRDFDLPLSNSIDNFRKEISVIENEISKMLSEQLASPKVQLIPAHLQKYEQILEKLFEELGTWNGDKNRYSRTFLTGLCRACNAKYAFIATLTKNKWHILGQNSQVDKEIQDDIESSSLFRDVLYQSSKQIGLVTSIRNLDIKRSLLYANHKSIQQDVICIYDIDNTMEFDTGFELILKSILDYTDGLKKPEHADFLEYHVNNALKDVFGFVSDGIYERQFSLFTQFLQDENITVYFEPIIYISPVTPKIFGWEALARDKRTGRAPLHLFDVAEKWGTRFLLELDMYFLRKATELYVLDSEHPEWPRRKNTILPLSVNVHPNSLIRTRYFEAMKSIKKQGIMPLNELYLEISEKAPIPITDDWDGETNIIDNFRSFITERFRSLDIHFSVDDFGVGYASASRISRLGPKVVKIDRDALLDDFGNFTLENIILLAKKMPGEIDIIVEGFDDFSKFTLRRLYKLGVRYIQGYRFGRAIEKIDDRLPKQIYNEIKTELKEFSE